MGAAVRLRRWHRRSEWATGRARASRDPAAAEPGRPGRHLRAVSPPGRHAGLLSASPRRPGEGLHLARLCGRVSAVTPGSVDARLRPARTDRIWHSLSGRWCPRRPSVVGAREGGPRPGDGQPDGGAVRPGTGRCRQCQREGGRRSGGGRRTGLLARCNHLCGCPSGFGGDGCARRQVGGLHRLRSVPRRPSSICGEMCSPCGSRPTRTAVVRVRRSPEPASRRTARWRILSCGFRWSGPDQ